jgi:predicted transcriptional regulator of viral defense system
MRTADAYRELTTLGRPLIETSEAAARLRVSPNTASKTLRAIERAGLIRQAHKGLWAVDPAVAPRVMAPYLTAPYPAYVSLWSALAYHDMIEQIPARIEVASLDRTRTVHTPMGVFAIHRFAPEVFTGFVGDPENGYMATPEKALFDTVYVRAPRGGRVRFPELTLPESFDRDQLERWVELIPRARLRTIVTRGVHDALEQADQHAADDY